jgi:hypothetical protein
LLFLIFGVAKLGTNWMLSLLIRSLSESGELATDDSLQICWSLGGLNSRYGDIHWASNYHIYHIGVSTVSTDPEIWQLSCDPAQVTWVVPRHLQRVSVAQNQWREGRKQGNTSKTLRCMEIYIEILSNHLDIQCIIRQGCVWNFECQSQSFHLVE